MKKKECRRIIAFVLLQLWILSIVSCKKDSQVPVLNTLEINSVTQTSVYTGGDITDDGGMKIIDKGVCWSTENNPNVNNSKISKGSGSGKFISAVTGLIPNTTYYLCSYATNAIGSGYGGVVSFKTQAIKLPDLTTTIVSKISQTTAISGGDIISDGGSLIVSRGLCWSTKQNPSLADSITLNGQGKGSFISNINNLLANTTYYVRAYATNKLGAAYGNELVFKTREADGTIGVVFDIDGNKYNTIVIGNQTWMSENYKSTKFNDGKSILEVKDSAKWEDAIAQPAYCWYKNNPETYKDTYGALYNWYTASSEKLCPSGWHVPTDNEWNVLSNYIGVSEGGKLKESGYIHWNAPNTGADNRYSFNAVPSGIRYSDGSGDFNDIGRQCYFWTSNLEEESKGQFAWGRHIHYDSDKLYRFSNYYRMGYGLSVRCVKDN